MDGRLDHREFVKAMGKLKKDENVVRVAAAAFHHALTGGLASNMAAAAGNTMETLRWKRSRGMGTEPLVATGALKRAITNNPPDKFGTKKGRKFDLNKNSGMVFVSVRTFKDLNGGGKKKLPAKGKRSQASVAAAIFRGRKKARIAGFKGRKRVIGGRGQAKGSVAARPLMYWQNGWIPVVESDVAKAMEKNFRGLGI